MKITQWRVSTFKLLTDAWSIIYVCKKCVMEKRKSLLQYEKFDESIKRLKEDILLQIWLFSDIKVNQKTIKCPNITLQLWIFVIMTKSEFKNYTRQSGKYMWVQTSRQQWGIWGLEETLWKVENTHAHIYMYTLHTKNVCFGFWTLSSAVPTFQCKTQVDNFNNWRIRNTVQLQTFVFWSLTISYKYLLRSAAGIKMAPQAYTRNVDRI